MTDFDNILALTAIRDITFATPLTGLSIANADEVNLSKVCSAEFAIQTGFPSPELNSLLTQLLGAQHRPMFRSATLEDYGAYGYAWTVTWELFPKLGGSTGIPFKWKAAITHDGQFVQPHLFLQSHFASYFGPENTIFCTLPMARLTPAPAALTASELTELKRVAMHRVRETFQAAGYAYKFRIDRAVSHEFPGNIPGIGDDKHKSVAWSLHFVEVNHEDRDPREFTVWADDSGNVGDFTIGRWDANWGKPIDEPKSRP
ncbi:hypothetical protein [Stieleria varia]|uniref:hypothetical protein n=1 Tax=Stieleria varia TaxID=2528005 RepID=UPI0011B3A4A1|nr:hypothetical protein [Stieleria varia]